MSINSKDISILRQNYSKNAISKENVSINPIHQFELWFKDAIEASILEPNAMVLSTIESNKPKSRIVLLKGLELEGFVFYTNYKSHKAKSMEECPFVSLLFFWDILERQIRIEGKVNKVENVVSDAYFNSRPRASQIGAWASEQSEVIKNAKQLEEQYSFYEEKFKDLEIIPRPEHWGGYVVVPSRFEFWQGRPSRLHDRIVYELVEKNWEISRLSS